MQVPFWAPFCNRLHSQRGKGQGRIPMIGSLPLVTVATSRCYTKVYKTDAVRSQWRELPQVLFLSRQVLLRQTQKFFISTFVATNTCLSQQKYAFRDKNIFSRPIILLSRQKTCFFATNTMMVKAPFNTFIHRSHLPSKGSNGNHPQLPKLSMQFLQGLVPA